jgi:hypothetical protein
MKIAVNRNITKSFFECVRQIAILAIENLVLISLHQHLTSWYVAFLVSTVFNFIFQVIYLHNESRLLSCGGFLIIFSYLFQCSFPLLFALNLVPNNGSTVLYLVSLVSSKNFMRGSEFGLNGIVILYLGYIVFINFSKIQDESTYHVWEYSYGFALVCAFVFGFFYYFSIISVAYYALTHGNYSTISTVRNSILVDIGYEMHGFYFGSLYMLVMYYHQRENDSKCNMILFLVAISVAISFLSGARSFGTLDIAIFLIFWINDVRKLNAKRAILFAVFILVGLQLIIGVRYVRSSSLSISSILSAMFSFKHSLFYEVLSEFGTSGILNGLFLDTSHTTHALDFFIKELLSVLPNISTWGGDIFLPPSERLGIEQHYHLGSSFIADFEFYFGQHGYLFMPIIGIEMAMVDNYIDSMRKLKDYYKIAVLFPFITALLNCVRASATLGLKMLVYSNIIYMILYSILLSKSRSRNMA